MQAGHTRAADSDWRSTWSRHRRGTRSRSRSRLRCARSYVRVVRRPWSAHWHATRQQQQPLVTGRCRMQISNVACSAPRSCVGPARSAELERRP
jgi:hypothetical protein